MVLRLPQLFQLRSCPQLHQPPPAPNHYGDRSIGAMVDDRALHSGTPASTTTSSHVAGSPAGSPTTATTTAAHISQ